MRLDTGVSAEVLLKIRETFSKYPQINSVVLYGSRALGRHKPGSDIDLTLKGVGLDLGVLNQLRTELDDLLLPYSFDLSLYDQIQNPSLVDHIDRVGVSFFP